MSIGWECGGDGRSSIYPLNEFCGIPKLGSCESPDIVCVSVCQVAEYAVWALDCVY